MGGIVPSWGPPSFVVVVVGPPPSGNGNGHSDDAGWREAYETNQSIDRSSLGASPRSQRRTRTITGRAAREINRGSPAKLGSDFLCLSLLLIAQPNEKRQPRPSSAPGRRRSGRSCCPTDS